MRNLVLRNYDPILYIQFGSNHDTAYGVSIVNEEKLDFKCGGNVIDSEFILTSASCFSQISSGPKVVIFDNGERLKITSIVVHPKNNEYHNDLVLIKLERKIRLQNMDQIICPAPFHLELNMYRFHRYSAETMDYLLAQSSGPELFYKITANYKDVSKFDFETRKTVNIRTRPISPANCLNSIQKIMNITEIDGDTQICAGNSRFAVPGLCQGVAGGSLIMEGLNEDSNNKKERMPYLVGVQSFGVDCGFGIPALASNVTSFIPWIDSVLYPRQTENLRSKAADESFKKCSSEHFVTLNETETNAYQEATFESTVLLGYIATDSYEFQWICEGAIISETIVLTTARCAASFGNYKIQIMVSPLLDKNQKFEQAELHHIHPGYSPKYGQNDIALVVTNPLKFDEFTVPACVWHNTTHLPFELRKVVFDFSDERKSISATALDMNPVINEDCAVYFEESNFIAEEEFCAAVDLELADPECRYSRKKFLSEALCSPTCEQKHGELMLHLNIQHGKLSTVVVGLSSAKNYCDLDKPLVFTRVSAYMDWIETFL